MQDTVNSFSQRATSIKRRAHRIDGDAISFNNTASSSKPLILAKQPQAQSVDRRIQKELEYSKPCKELKTLEIYHFKGGQTRQDLHLASNHIRQAGDTIRRDTRETLEKSQTLRANQELDRAMGLDHRRRSGFSASFSGMYRDTTLGNATRRKQLHQDHYEKLKTQEHRNLVNKSKMDYKRQLASVYHQELGISVPESDIV